MHEKCFQIPIHPKLLDPELKIDEAIARNVLPAVELDWHNDLTEYTSKLEEGQIKEWITRAFLKGKPSYWISEIHTAKNGLARVLSISRDGGGSLCFDEMDSNCKTAVFFKHGGYIQFDEEKIKEFNFDKNI